MLDLWEYKAERDGGNAQAYAKLSKEIDQYLAAHRDETSAAGTVGILLSGIRISCLRNSSSASFPPWTQSATTLNTVSVQILPTQAMNETDPDTAQI